MNTSRLSYRLLGLAVAFLCFLPGRSVAGPDESFSRLDAVVQEAIAKSELPGAVVLVAHKGRVVLHKAYGFRVRMPVPLPAEKNTIYDLASLTKPIATATSIMLLLEQNKLKVTDRVAQHLPAFGENGKDRITIEHLLLHTSGLIADNPIGDYANGRDKAFERIYALKPVAGLGERFIYSDVNYIVLGELVTKLAGMPLDVFAQTQIFDPLRMTSTGFASQLFSRERTGSALRQRTAPTEQREGRWMLGEVHDPRAYLLGGVAGHAGLFSDAEDLKVYAQMLLQGGTCNGKRILRPETVRLMTTPRPVPGGLRAYGWDVDTSYSKNRGDIFPRGKSFGHTGFTGTSIWIDPTTETVVIFLSNRVHPDGKGNVTKLRGQIATIAAHAFSRETPVGTLTGIDILVRENFARLKGRRIGLVTNHTGVDREGRATIDLLHNAAGVTLVALFSPEHGIRGMLDEKVGDSKDEKTGLPIYSLYGARRKPTTETLKGIDTLVYDIQDIGCRFYTYSTTLGYILEAAAEHKLRVVVLDRPNPIGGIAVEGPVRDAGRESFVAYHTVPVRHGMTFGELAQMFNAERRISADLEVVKMEGWHRGDFYDRTGLTWINPSPNMRSLTQAFLYPGIGLLETTNVSVGRGTDRPFEWIGAPWLDGRRLAAALAEQKLEGVRFVPAKLTPASSTHKGMLCGGMQIIIDDWSRFQPLRTGLAIACELRRLYSKEWTVEKYDTLLVHKLTWETVKSGAVWSEIEKSWQLELEEFRQRRKAFLIYSK